MFVRDSFEFIPRGICTVSAGQDAGGGGAAAGGASNGAAQPAGQAPASGSANGHEPAATSQPLTLDSIKALLDERDKVAEKRFKKVNDELAAYRRGTRGATPGEGQAQPQEPSTGGERGAAPRDERRVEREFNRVLGELQASGLDAETIERIETKTDSMTVEQREIYTEALREGLKLGKKPGASVTGDREVGTGTQRTQGPRGRSEGPAPKTPSVTLPGSWDEYADLPKTEAGRARKAALDKLPIETFDPVELHARWQAERRGGVVIRKG